MKFRMVERPTTDGNMRFLSILRPNGWIAQICPFSRIESYSLCGQWCPHFGEIASDDSANRNSQGTLITCNQLELCHGKVIRGEFVSEEGE